MVMQPFTFHKPDNGATFETYCLKVFRTHLKLPHLQKFGRLGHSQFGIDLLSAEPGHVVGIQCRSKLTAKGLTKEEVDKVIEDATTFEPHLDELLIATSADRDPDLQRHIVSVNLNHQTAGLFKVFIYAWQDIEDILKQDSDLVNDLYSLPGQPVSTANIVTHAPINYQPLPGAAHAEIDEAAQYITEGNPDAGLALLQRLRRERWDRLNSRERFRVLANIGNGFLRKRDELGAARAFLEAATHQPSDDDAALSIAAHGHLLSGNPEQAYRMASEACLRNSMNERAQIMRVKSAPSNISLEELRNTIPPTLQFNLNVALSLYERAMDEKNPIEAEKVLRAVREDSPVLHFSLGAALLQQGLPAGVHEGLHLLPRDSALVRQALDHLTKAIESPGSPSDLIAPGHFNRALASLLLADERSAFADFRSAHDKEPDNESFATAFTLEAWRLGETVSALSGARELFKNHPTTRSRLLLGMVLYDSGGEVEKQETLTLLQEGMAELGEVEPELRLEYLRRTLYFFQLSEELRTDTPEAMVKYLSNPLERAIIRSWALHRLGFRDQAEKEAKEASALLDEATSLPLRREVAALLSRLGLAEEALPIWLEISSPSIFNEDTEALLQTAYNVGKDDLILDYCEQLRAKGIYVPEIALMEIELLVRYNELQRARLVLREYLDFNPNDLSLRLSLLNIAVVERWAEIVNVYMTTPPDFKSIKTVADGARLVQILQFTGAVNAAVAAAYDLVRRFPDDPLSHRALIVSILGWPKKGDLALDAPQQVVSGSAVCIRTGDELEWIVIENSEKPEISRGEYSPEHPLSRALIGKSVGDSVTLPQSLVRSKTAVVAEIKHKMLFRMHQSMEQMNRRFPEQSFFESVSIDFDAKGHELDDLLEVNRQVFQGRIEAEKLYNEKRIPVNVLARAAGREIPLVIEAFARDEKRTIHCAEGKAEEFERAKGVIDSTRELVIDLTALSTIGLLGEDFDLSKMPIKCIVSEGTLESLKRFGRSDLEDERVQGYMVFDEDRVIIQEINPDLERARAARATEFAMKIESVCEIVGGRPLARAAVDTRKMLLHIFGSETAESIMIARERNCPLWTDDYVTSLIVERELSMGRVWTQPISFRLRDFGILTDRECDVTTSRLCGFDYKFTSISWRTIIVACNLCEWNPDKQPLRGVLDRFEDYGRGQDMLLAAAGLIPAIWREAPLYDSAVRVTIRILEKLSRSTGGIATIRTILQQIDIIFGVNVIGGENARKVIAAGLATAMRGRVIES